MEPEKKNPFGGLFLFLGYFFFVVLILQKSSSSSFIINDL